MEPRDKRNQCNNGFWELHPDERAARREVVERRNDGVSFYDLPVEERAKAYDNSFGNEHDYY